MYRVKLWGSYADIGCQQALPPGVCSPPSPDARVLRFAKECEERLALHAPELLIEVRGFADATGNAAVVEPTIKAIGF